MAKELSEGDWVEQIRPSLEKALGALAYANTEVRVRAKVRLPYSFEVHRYEGATVDHESISANLYQTDLLIYDEGADGKWTPRLVIECKIEGVSTHDALTYSAKASTHKQVHPYLRYGILIGKHGQALPAKLARHGAHFDFMMVWQEAKATEKEWNRFIDVVMEEVRASRTLERFLTDRTKQAPKYSLVHRPLKFEDY